MFTCSYCKKQCEGKPHKARHSSCGDCFNRQLQILRLGIKTYQNMAEEKKRRALETGMRVCAKCKKTKPLSDFYTDAKTWMRPCKRCARFAQADRRARKKLECQSTTAS